MCTDDVQYQAVRQMTRNPEWQSMMLKKPLAERQAFAAQARAASLAHGQNVNTEITDVNQNAVEETFRKYGVTRMLRPCTSWNWMGGPPHASCWATGMNREALFVGATMGRC